MLAAYTVAMRVGVIFKTQSVVMPAFLAAIAGPGWVQGFLPMLNRWGQSVPPLFAADALRDRPLKRRWVWATTLGMSAAFAALAAVLAVRGDAFRGPGAVAAFLTLYGAFFVATGLNDLGFSTLQAKLIRPSRRGELVAAGGIVGSLVAVTAAVTYLRDWRATGPGDFVAAFAAAAGAMALAGLIVLAVREPADRPGPGRRRFRASVGEARAVLRDDGRFRRIAAVAVLFVTAQLLFPHYVPLAAGRFGGGALPLTEYVIAQNLGAGLFSVLLGRLADRFGNRLTVRLSLGAAAAVPVAALLAAPRGHAARLHSGVFPAGDDAGRLSDAHELHAGADRPVPPPAVREHPEAVPGRPVRRRRPAGSGGGRGRGRAGVPDRRRPGRRRVRADVVRRRTAGGRRDPPVAAASRRRAPRRSGVDSLAREGFTGRSFATPPWMSEPAARDGSAARRSGPARFAREGFTPRASRLRPPTGSPTERVRARTVRPRTVGNRTIRDRNVRAGPDRPCIEPRAKPSPDGTFAHEGFAPHGFARVRVACIQTLLGWQAYQGGPVIAPNPHMPDSLSAEGMPPVLGDTFAGGLSARGGSVREPFANDPPRPNGPRESCGRERYGVERITPGERPRPRNPR